MKIRNKVIIKNIVFDYFQYLWDMKAMDEIDFKDLFNLVKRDRPDSKFSPAHLSVYKSQFMREKNG